MRTVALFLIAFLLAVGVRHIEDGVKALQSIDKHLADIGIDARLETFRKEGVK